MTDLSDNQIELSNGEVFTVPRLPGGVSDEARKVFDLVMTSIEEGRRTAAANQLVDLEEKEARRVLEGDELTKRLAEIDDSREDGRRKWMRETMTTGFEMLRALYNLDREEPITEQAARVLFQWPDIVTQTARAKTITLTGGVPREGGDRSDFTEPEKDSSTTVDDG